MNTTNWDWVRSTYSPLTGSRPAATDEALNLPSCVANGLSARQRKALLRVFAAASRRAEARMYASSPTIPSL